MGDLHGNAPDRSRVVLLLIDVINDLEFPGGKELAERAITMAHSLSELLRRAREADVAVVYANDNFGKWRSDFRAQLRHCLDEPVAGRPIAQLLRPLDSDYFVLKPKHSAFYSTALDLLLRHLEARTLVLTGITAESCVLFTANDAYLRDYAIVVPPDCVASQSDEAKRRSLAHMEQILKADMRPSSEIDWLGR